MACGLRPQRKGWHSPGPRVGPAGVQPSLREALSLGMRAVGTEPHDEDEASAHQGTWNRTGHNQLPVFPYLKLSPAWEEAHVWECPAWVYLGIPVSWVGLWPPQNGGLGSHVAPVTCVWQPEPECGVCIRVCVAR